MLFEFLGSLIINYLSESKHSINFVFWPQKEKSLDTNFFAIIQMFEVTITELECQRQLFVIVNTYSVNYIWLGKWNVVTILCPDSEST